MAEPVKIGDATLYLGDCLEILPTLVAGSIHMIWTDPPYGHKNHEADLISRLNGHAGRENQPIENDDQENMKRVVAGMLSQAARVLRSDACCCCCCCAGGGPTTTFAWLAQRLNQQGLRFFHSVIWDKKNPGLGWRYKRQHEMVMVAHRSRGSLLWQNPNIATGNIYVEMPPRERSHPNEKPVAMVKHFLRLHSSQGHTILDPFMGSGTTGVACAKLGRKFIGIEIEPRYFDIACRRIERAYAEPDLFIEPPKPAKQEAML